MIKEIRLSQEDSVCAIFRENDVRGECIGSGTLVLIENMPFLITAKHVLEGLELSKGLILSSAKLDIFKLFKCEIFSHPKYDFAYIPLGIEFLNATINKILYYDMSSLHEIFSSFDKSDEDYFTVYGYPYSQNKFTKNRIKIKQFLYSTIDYCQEHSDFLRQNNYDQELFRVLKFNENKISYDDNSNKVIIPKTESISGGGVYNNWNNCVITSKDGKPAFKRISGHGDNQLKFELDSIVIERVYNPDILICLRIKWIILYIKEKYNFHGKTNIDFDCAKKIEIKK